MNLLFGAHEVRLFRPGGVAVGYFDNWEAALKAVENESSLYKAAYFTLNPLTLPEGIPLNPVSLLPSTNAAGASDVERRVWLLIDCDPPRPAKTNSTAEEKQAAREEAERIREWLESHGWPEPMLCDSGNGWHLLDRIELPNDEASTTLLKSFLAQLKQRFPIVDKGNFDAPRLCKLYGSWVRKGENTEERPWRRSAIVEEGNGGVVTEEQIRALTPAPVIAEARPRNGDDANLSNLLRFLDCYEVAIRSKPCEVQGGWRVEIECPWVDEHSDETPRDTAVSFIAGRGNGFKCFHSHCTERHWQEFRAELQRMHPNKKFSFAGEVGNVTLGGGNGNKSAPVTDQPLKLAEKRTKPAFPDQSWEGTVYGQFASILCRGTFMRKRLASEIFRGITGALAGDQVTCGINGVRLREYIAALAVPQSGKNHALDRAVDFYTKEPPVNPFVPLLIQDGGPNEHRPTGIGAQRFLPGSANSFVDELTREEKREEKSKKNKEEAESTRITLNGVNITSPPPDPKHYLWKPTARFVTLQGEAMTLFSRMCSNDWTGKTLTALVTDLYDSLDAEVPITKERGAPKQRIRVQYSMVLCTQPQTWRKHMADHMMDSGLFGRFYIVGTETKPRKVTLPDFEDAGLFHELFGQLRQDVFARLEALRHYPYPLRLTVAQGVKQRIEDWENSLPQEDELFRDLTSRMGIHVWRAALARAWGWMPQRNEITLEDADAAIRLGEFQIKMREYYAPTPGDSPRWKHLNAVRAAIEQAGQTTQRELRRKVQGDRFPEDFEWALGYLEKRGFIVMAPAPRKQVHISWVLDREG